MAELKSLTLGGTKYDSFPARPYWVDVTITGSATDGTYSTAATAADVLAAIEAGLTPVVRATGTGDTEAYYVLALIIYEAPSTGLRIYQFTRSNLVMALKEQENGSFEVTNPYEATDEVTTLPNPYKLTFTGAVSAEYDGSAAVSVEIPEGGGGTTPTAAEKIVEYTVDADSASATSFTFTVADYPNLAKYNHLRGIFRKSTNGSMPWVQVVLNAAATGHANRMGRMDPTSYGMCGFEITNNAGYYLGGVTDAYNPSLYSEWVMAAFPYIRNCRAFPLYLEELTMVSVLSYTTFLDEGGKIEIWGWND